MFSKADKSLYITYAVSVNAMVNDLQRLMNDIYPVTTPCIDQIRVAQLSKAIFGQCSEITSCIYQTWKYIVTSSFLLHLRHLSWFKFRKRSEICRKSLGVGVNCDMLQNRQNTWQMSWDDKSHPQNIGYISRRQPYIWYVFVI